jgi:hypothetical protein
VEIVLAILGGGAGSALVGGTFALIQWKLNRKAAQEDQAEAVSTASCAARGQEIRDLKRLVNVLVEADRTILYDRIKHLGKSYIARGYITVEELEDIDLMHGVYHDKDKLGGNGFLDALMKTVHALDVRVS